MKNEFFTLRAGLMRPFGVLSEDRSMLIRLHLGCLPNGRIRPVRSPGYKQFQKCLLVQSLRWGRVSTPQNTTVFLQVET